MEIATKTLIEAGATLLAGCWAFKGTYSFIDVFKGQRKLRKAVSDLETYISENSAEALNNAKSRIQKGYHSLTSHWHVFPLSPSAKKLDNLVEDLDNQPNNEIQYSIIPKINNVKDAYRGPGNCPYVKMLIPLGATIYFGIQTIKALM